MQVNIQNQFSQAVQYFEDVQQLETIGTPTLQNGAEAAAIISQIESMMNGSNLQISSMLNTAVGSQVKGAVQTEINSLVDYMKSITVQVPATNDPGGYINLYVGTVSESTGYVSETFQNEQGGVPQAASLWDLVSNPEANLIVNSSDINLSGSGYQTGSFGPYLNCNWGNDTQLTFDITGTPDHYADEYIAAVQGSASQWLPYISLNTSNADSGSLQKSLVSFENSFG